MWGSLDGFTFSDIFSSYLKIHSTILASCENKYMHLLSTYHGLRNVLCTGETEMNEIGLWPLEDHSLMEKILLIECFESSLYITLSLDSHSQGTLWWSKNHTVLKVPRLCSHDSFCLLSASLHKISGLYGPMSQFQSAWYETPKGRRILNCLINIRRLVQNSTGKRWEFVSDGDTHNTRGKILTKRVTSSVLSYIHYFDS